jgi:Holliday junction DNA helicase RuvB
VEERDGQGEHWIGWSWHEVRTPAARLNRLVTQGVVRIPYRSNSSTYYRLEDPDTVREALRVALLGVVVQVDEPAAVELPEDLFDVVEGMESAKRVLRLALEADRPVHVLLVGPPGSAKTVLLSEIARLPGGRYALGGTTTRAGLVGYLLAEPGTRHLLIDELDKMDGRDLSALLSVMETGTVTRLQHGRQESERRAVRVFAGANDDRFAPELLDRFVPVRLEPYGDEQFERVAAAVLVRREGCDPELAQEIAHLMAGRTNSVRDAVQVARLARGDRRLARELVEEVL